MATVQAMVQPETAERIREEARRRRVPVSMWARWVFEDTLKMLDEDRDPDVIAAPGHTPGDR